jgi:hypothetical protein
MKNARKAAIGVRSHSGWAAFIVLAGPADAPAVIDRRRVVLVGPGIPKQPYHAALGLRLPEAGKLVDRCVAGSRRLAAAAIDDVIALLENGGRVPVGCGLCLASGRALPGLEAILASHPLVHTAEGELFRDAIAHAAQAAGLPVAGVREKEIWDRAAAALALPAGEIRRRADEMGRPLGPPWTQDQKLAALAAWLALAADR